ncbi:glycosyltransferase family 2 protein [Nostoc sp. CHAB 5834]|nr:glycosyltransferase family 2 protein [Nostoc sp. CHAB 5834]
MERKRIGHLDSVVDGIASGWAYDSNNPEAASVAITVNGMIVGVGIASLEREDLVSQNLPSIKCGFQFRLFLQSGDVVSARFYDSDQFLTNSPIVLGSDDFSISIASVMKNEGPYLIEWIAYHQALGFSNFFIADNDSTDETSQILRVLGGAGILEFIRFPTVQGVAPQLPAFNILMNSFKNRSDLIALIDADEFIVPMDGYIENIDRLKRIFCRKNVGSVALNWRLFGSSGLKKHDARPVMQRFRYRGVDGSPGNRHCKHIVRSNAFLEMGENPHLVRLSSGFLSIDTLGRDLMYAEEPGITEQFCPYIACLNHYVVKSEEEYWNKKVSRGRGTTDDIRGREFFEAHDLNDQRDDLFDKMRSSYDQSLKSLRCLF